MQGRLTEKKGFLPQCFPWENWKQEFVTAKTLGLSYVEWMFNDSGWQKNPIFEASQIEDIILQIKSTGIFVSGICANYFIKNCLFPDMAEGEKRNAMILQKLVKHATQIGCHNIILPIFGESARLFEDINAWERTKRILGMVESKEINILFETDTALEIVEECLHEISSVKTGICYDIGNATGLNRDVIEEVKVYSNIIREYHIKDKEIGGSTVMLGKGDTPFLDWMEWLRKNKFNGSLIMESYYDTDAIGDTKENLEFIKELLRR